MAHEHTAEVKPIEFLWLGLYGFAGFSLELILSVVIDMVGVEPLGKGSHLLVTGILWFAFATFLFQFAKRRFHYDLLEKRESLTASKLIVNIVLVALIVAATTWGFGGFKPYIEFHGGSQGSILLYLLQVFYYLGEVALIVLTIAFGQQFAEKQFGLKKSFPSGGLFLALTWGIMHFLLQGFSGGIYTIFFSVVVGIIYTVMKKDFRWSYFFIALAFIL